MITITANGVEYDIMGENFKSMERNGLSAEGIRNRIIRNWSLNEACHVPKRMNIDEYRTLQQTLIKEEDTSEAKARYKEERLRKQKPHLFNVEQQHSESKYAKYLWNSYKFKCAEVAE
ncbi:MULTISPECIES: SA1788 family PVL leukocidin-associated protein [Staphylococcus]|uniref:Phage protein n=1 Tax=Staphylococcus pseudoxylosus TaxID=2282419 RepID=A0AAQ0MHX1_9STAP|nr:SA1788 family PVL leukocidin-associated protein [Staphylococcus pseudoxylosus]MCE5001721.1 hypothetical protein [Staphylococcus pseudoxylosus]RMI85622.1 hypothetical protein D9V42_04435 [Staphylococcus pseudoxylosus]